MKYQTTLLEDWIKEFYYRIGIYHPRQLDLLEIAARLGFYVSFQKFSSRIYNGEILIDERLSDAEQWEDFGHEVCHLIRQDGNQLIMSNQFLDMQESKAESFALHFCVPTFMLLKHEIANYYGTDGVLFVMDTYCVTKSFAKRRLDHFKNQLNQAKSDDEFRKRKEPVTNYSKDIKPKAIPKHAESIVALALSRKNAKEVLCDDYL
jgi:Zn-dependent peptidase ImmA (M78 family)